MKLIVQMATAICTPLIATVLELQALFDLQSPMKLQALLVRLVFLLAFSAWGGIGLLGQEIVRPDADHFLPPATGALTLTPDDMPDVSCSVVEWKHDSATPALAVICPPQDTFAPLHMYLKLSWLKPEDVPLSARGITAPAKSLIKIRTKDSTAWVWLGVREKYGAPCREWVAFNGVLDMALLTLRPKR